MERGINMKKNMRKAISVLLIAIAAVMLLAGCGTKNQETDIEEQTPPEEVVVDEGEPESESSDTLDKTYLLSDLEYMDAGTGEWTPSDFVPGAEKYVFHDDYSCEYIYRDYPSYEDMMNDSNYETVTKSGVYVFNAEEGGVTMMYDEVPVIGAIDGDQLIIVHEYNGEPAIRGTYTEAEE